MAGVITRAAKVPYTLVCLFFQLLTILLDYPWHYFERMAARTIPQAPLPPHIPLPAGARLPSTSIQSDRGDVFGSSEDAM